MTPLVRETLLTVTVIHVKNIRHVHHAIRSVRFFSQYRMILDACSDIRKYIEKNYYLFVSA